MKVIIGVFTFSFCRFWEVLGYFADTLIFIIVGIVISLRAFQDVDYMDWIYNVALYFAIVVIRYNNCGENATHVALITCEHECNIS